MNWVLQEHADCCLCGHPRTSLSMRTERTVLGLGEAGQVVPQQGVRRTRDPRPYSWACALLLTHRSWVCVHTLFLSRVTLGLVAKFALQPVRIPHIQGLCRERQNKPETANSDAHSSQAGSLPEGSMSGDGECWGDCGKLGGACPF